MRVNVRSVNYELPKGGAKVGFSLRYTVEFFKELGVFTSEIELETQVQQAQVAISDLAQLDFAQERLGEFIERVTQLINEISNEHGFLLPVQRMN